MKAIIIPGEHHLSDGKITARLIISDDNGAEVARFVCNDISISMPTEKLFTISRLKPSYGLLEAIRCVVTISELQQTNENIKTVFNP
jgi:hypothetical protein